MSLHQCYICYYSLQFVYTVKSKGTVCLFIADCVSMSLCSAVTQWLTLLSKSNCHSHTLSVWSELVIQHCSAHLLQLLELDSLFTNTIHLPGLFYNKQLNCQKTSMQNCKWSKHLGEDFNSWQLTFLHSFLLTAYKHKELHTESSINMTATFIWSLFNQVFSSRSRSPFQEIHENKKQAYRNKTQPQLTKNHKNNYKSRKNHQIIKL